MSHPQPINLARFGWNTLTTLATSGVFSREFYVTDGELHTPFSVDFDLGGIIENTDNSYVNSCFNVVYSLGSLDSKYDEFNSNSGTNKKVRLLSKVDGSGNFEWFGMVSAKDSTVTVTVDKNPDCFTGTETFSETLPLNFNLNKNTKRDFSITVSGVADPYEFTIAGTDCLGPFKVGRDGGYGSCCDVDRINSLESSKSFNFLETENFIMPSSTLAFELNQSYLCVQTPRASALSDWDIFSSSLITKQLPTNIEIYCSGTSALLQEGNIQTFGDTSLGTHINVNNSLPVELKIDSTSVGTYPNCKECSQDLVNGFQFRDSSGNLVTLNPTIRTQNAIDGLFLESYTQSGVFVRDDVDSMGNPISICEDRYFDRRCYSGSSTSIHTGSSSEFTC